MNDDQRLRADHGPRLACGHRLAVHGDAAGSHERYVREHACHCLIRHPQTPEQRREVEKALDYARGVNDPTGIMVALAQLAGPCPAWEVRLNPACVGCGAPTSDVRQDGARYCEQCGWLTPAGATAPEVRS